MTFLGRRQEWREILFYLFIMMMMIIFEKEKQWSPEWKEFLELRQGF